MTNDLLKPMDLLKMKWRPRNNGLWRLNPEHLTLTLYKKGVPNYEVDLERCRSSAEILDWIGQICGKTWATSEIVGELALALNDYLRFQSNFCSGGSEKGPRNNIRDIIESRMSRLDFENTHCLER